jgi:hypothetical protein
LQMRISSQHGSRQASSAASPSECLKKPRG